MFTSIGSHKGKSFQGRSQSMPLVLLASMISLLLFVPIHFAAGCCHTLAVTEGVLAAVILLLYWRLRCGTPLEIIENALMVCAVILFSALIFTETIASTGAYWAAGFPFVSYFVKSVHMARLWVLIFWLEIVGAALLVQMQLINTPYTPVQLACLAVVVGFFWFLAHIYQAQYEAQRKRLEASYKQIDKHRSRLKTILDHAPNSIWMVDMNGRIRFANKAMERWTGISEEALCAMKDYTALLPEDVASRSREGDRLCLEGEQDVCFAQESIPDVHGRPKTFDLIRVKVRDGHGNLTGLVGFAIDISERLAAEKERHEWERRMLHVQRLESLGLMAGGVAHDFNNLLTAMRGGVDLVRTDKHLTSGTLESLDCIETAVEAATDLCQQMLAYSGKGFMQADVLNINDLLKEMRPLLFASIGKDAELHFSLADSLPAVEVDKGQIRQVILNMVMNAAEAIGDQSGDIVIQTSMQELGDVHEMKMVGEKRLPAGQYVVFEIRDSGPGMSTETQSRIFDPFYTTKFTGRGLGMSAVLGIVHSHQGDIAITSAPGEGTSMQVWLPASSRHVPLSDHGAEKSSPVVSSLENKRQGCVLVIDDEEDVMHVARRMLEHLGMAVLSARDGAEGIELYRIRHSEIDWILLDMTMPNMNGNECLLQLREISPDAYVVMSSGYNQESVAPDTMQGRPQDFLKKPYSLVRLREVSNKAMAADRD